MIPSISSALLRAGDLRVRFSTRPGEWLSAWIPGQAAHLRSSGRPRPIQVKLKGQGWLSPARPPRVARRSASEVELTWRVGPVKVAEVWTAHAHGLARRLSVTNVSSGEVQLIGVRMLVTGLSLGAVGDCRLEVPATCLRPRLVSEVFLDRKLDDPWPATLVPAARDLWGLAVGDAPDFTPGLLAVHNERLRTTLMVWYHSETEAATPLAFGDGERLSLGHAMGLAGWLAPGASLAGGTQYLDLAGGDWADALRDFRQHYSRVGLVPPLYGSPPPWVATSAVYEAHPGPFGGFDGLAKELRRLRGLGFDVLYLLPVMAYENLSGAVWDENWVGSGSPYAMKDFEVFESTLGGEPGFRRLVSRAHRVGMRVLMDFVPQGCGRQARYVEEHPEWFCRDERGQLVSSHNWTDTYSFDWANPDYQQYMLGWALRLARQYDLDGYRIDAPHAKEPNWDRAIPYHASATSLGVLRLLERLRAGLAAISPDKAMLCELFGPVFTRSHDFQYDYHPCVNLHALLRGDLSVPEIGEWLKDYWAVQPPGAVRLTFTETHDTRTQMSAYALRGSAAERAMFAILILAGFVPMVWCGQERGLEDWYRKILRARTGSAALLTGRRRFNAVRSSHPDVLSILLDGAGEKVWGLVSLHAERTPITLTLPSDFGLASASTYRLYDLIEQRPWAEGGKSEWRGETLRELTLSPEPFVPYFFRIEP
jgi:glycosidase